VTEQAVSAGAAASGTRGGAWPDRLLLIAILLFVFVLGAFVGGCALHDPDTCWLLTMGNWIVGHHRLPAADPYSWTYPLVGGGQPPVVYQWLGEVIFSLAYRAAGLTGLLYLAAFALTLSFLIIPLARLRAAGAGDLPAALLVVTGVIAASFHFLARPEIFSYFLLSVWLALIAAMEGCPPAGARDGAAGRRPAPSRWGSAGLRLPAAFFVLAILWANLHTGFVVGLIALALYVVLRHFEALSGIGGPPPVTVWLCLGAVALGTLVNPYGVGLWQYLPRLFFVPFNARIVELRPLSAADFAGFTFYPYLLAAAGAVWLVLAARRAAGPAKAGWFPAVVLAAAIVSGLACRRLIPFSVLLMLHAVAVASARAARGRAAPAGATGRLYNPSSIPFAATCLALGLGGVYLVASQVAPPRLPSASAAFQPPLAAISRLVSMSEPGRLLNDPQFGDVMIWSMSPLVPVFIDSRYDMYGSALVGDYLTMTECRPGWRQLVDRWRIGLVFLPPGAPLVEQLGRDRHWAEVYRDRLAVILRKKGR